MNPLKDLKYLYDTIYKDKPECKYDGGPRFLPDDIALSRIVMIREEIQEYEDAVNAKDMEEVLDALIDFTVFAVGTAYLHGFSNIFEEAWYRVQNANLQKYAGNTGRGSDCDMVKPKGWKPPTFKDLL